MEGRLFSSFVQADSQLTILFGSFKFWVHIANVCNLLVFPEVFASSGAGVTIHQNHIMIKKQSDAPGIGWAYGVDPHFFFVPVSLLLDVQSRFKRFSIISLLQFL